MFEKSEIKELRNSEEFHHEIKELRRKCAKLELLIRALQRELAKQKQREKNTVEKMYRKY